MVLTALEGVTEVIQAMAEGEPSQVAQLFDQHLCQPAIEIKLIYVLFLKCILSLLELTGKATW